jgi:hypothetical protein
MIPGNYCPGVSYSLALISGAATRSRTPDLLITSELLYQLSYGGSGRRFYKKLPNRGNCPALRASINTLHIALHSVFGNPGNQVIDRL